MTIADLKNNLSHYLREVRRGESLTVLSRDVPVARLVPVEPGNRLFSTRPPDPGVPRLGNVPLPPPLAIDVDIVQVLLDERGER